MRVNRRIADWLENHWVTPAYSGWLLISLSFFFFIAATNTLSGWLYVLSGIGLALLTIAALLPERTLRQIQVTRSPIHPVSAGDQITVEVIIKNCSHRPKALLQLEDVLPKALGAPERQGIELIPPQQEHHWIYCHPTQQRGIYRWHQVGLRTAAPLGLFWCRRDRSVPAMAIVYPTVLPLTRCPLVDQIGRDLSLQYNSDRLTQAATEGLTRSLRPYRWGDPTRLVHWRSSARYGELRVRELEVFTGGQDLVICLDSAPFWQTGGTSESSAVPPDFEQAVIAAASLYFYACHRNITVKLWTAGTGLIQGNQVVLAALAATNAGETVQADHLPNLPLVWLTQNPESLSTLPLGSRWILWSGDRQSSHVASASELLPSPFSSAGIAITPSQSLQLQLQNSLDS